MKRRVSLSLLNHKFDFCMPTDKSLRSIYDWWVLEVLNGKWERPVIELVQGVVQHGDMFIDVGAWWGPYTLMCSSLVLPSGWCYSFEPDPVARALLERNIRANRVSNVTVLPHAVTDTKGPLYLDAALLGASLTKVARGSGVAKVPATTLDGFCEQHEIQPSIIKIDVEGGEDGVFAGGMASIQKARVVILEFHEQFLFEAGKDAHKFWESLFNINKRVIGIGQEGGHNRELRRYSPIMDHVALHVALL